MLEVFAEGYFQAVAALKDEPTLAADEPGDEATEADPEQLRLFD